jgi:hypothetical protein
MKIKGRIFDKKIPTIVGVVILLAGLVTGILLVSKPQNLLTRAGPTDTPKNVKISNVGAESATVSWTTDIPVTGMVKYSDNPSNLSLPGTDVRDQLSGEAGLFTTHYVTITNLSPSKTYYFEIMSGSASYDDNDRPYQLRTGVKASSRAEDVMKGKIVASEGQGVEGAIVYVEIDGGETLSALTKIRGDWQLDLSKVRNDKGVMLAYDLQNQPISLFVQGGVLGTATALTNTANDNPVGDVMMGTNVNLIGDTAALINQAGQKTGGDSSVTGSGFGQLADAGTNEDSQELINPVSDGEKIATSSPEFRGKLPAGTSVTITVNSETEQTTTITVDENGEWVWTPPMGLEPGEHTIEVEYEDEGGVLQKITRSFVVLAAEETDGLPAFTATASATPTASLTPAEASGSSMPSTESGVPEAGVLTSTYWLLIVGVGLFITGEVSRRWTKTI